MRDPDTGQFILGHTGIGGRPKGSRNKLGEAFIADLYAEWGQHGPAVVAKVREEHPIAFLRVIASIVRPTEMNAHDPDKPTITKIIQEIVHVHQDPEMAAEMAAIEHKPVNGNGGGLNGHERDRQ